MSLIYITAILAILSLALYILKTAKGQIGSKFKILVSCLLKLDKNLKIEYQSNESIILFSSNNRGSISIFLFENHKLLYLTMESVNTDNYIEKKEWFFISQMNQYLIFDEIITSFFKECRSDVFSPKKIKQSIHLAAEQTKNINLEPVFSKKNISQSSFCLAFSNIRILAPLKNANIQNSFEILFFNCAVCYQKIDKAKCSLQWQDYIVLLAQYLDNQSLSKQIGNLTGYFNYRIAFYTKQLELIKNGADPDYDSLYYYFFEKPFSTKVKIKREDSDKRKFIETLHILIAEVENKTAELESLSLQH
ncbi:hypothetical protein ABXT06_22240 [Flavobacterium sp. UW10123]|uniref:hypothetical protein n=1 Tax=Flavobacterium sp. UW10123 TaxID=3230800 RepID=UPI00339A7A07